MLLVIECHHGAGGVRCNIALFRWHRHHWVRDSHDIGGVFARGQHGFCIVGIVADDTLGVVAPLAVAAKALTVIGALEARLAEIVGISLAAVTFTAGRNLAGRAEMVAGFASLVHVRHLSVDLMIEMYGAVLINQFIEQERIGRLGNLMFRGRLRPGQVGTGFETGIIAGGIGAGMALDTIKFQPFHILLGIESGTGAV